MAEPTDGQLVRAFLGGEREAASTLILRHQAAVRALLLRLTGRHDHADDLAQETFIRLLRFAHQYDENYPMRPWLLTIARRLWINQHRAKRPTGEAEQIDLAASREPDPSDELSQGDDQRAQRRALDAALQQLTEAQRTVVVLFYQQQLPLKEVSQVMELPEGTVKSHLHRARESLRKLLESNPEVIPS